MRYYQDLEITGSVYVTGSIVANDVTASFFHGTASYAATSSFLDIEMSRISTASFSASMYAVGMYLSESYDTASATTSSVDTVGTGSFHINADTTITGSLRVLGGIIGVDTSLISTGSATASLQFDVSGSSSFYVNTSTLVSGTLSVTGGTFSGSGANLYDISASSIVGLNLARISSASYSASMYAEGMYLSESYDTASATTSSVNTVGTGSFHVNTNTYITGSLTADSLFANSASIIHLTNVYETSSYIYLTGSTKFGDNAGEDVHEFTGSVGITGSLAVDGPASFKDDIQITGSVGISGSLQVSGTFTVIGTDGSSLQINVPSDPTTGSLFAILDTSNNYVFEVFADRITKLTGSVEITGSLGVTGGITGSLTGSFKGEGTGSFTGSFTGSLLGTASHADTASYATNASSMDGGIY